MALISLDGNKYQLAEGPGAIDVIYESTIVQQPDLPGESRPSKNARPDIPTYVKSDWSAGEGYKFYDGRPEHPSQEGYLGSSSSGVATATQFDSATVFALSPVNTRKRGQVSLGFAEATSYNHGSAIGSGPYLKVAGGKMFAAIDTATRGLIYQDPVDTWTPIGGVTDAGNVVGPISSFAGGVFLGNGTDLIRATTAGVTGAAAWNADNATAAHVADNRVYYFIPGATSATLRRANIDVASAGATVGSFLGVGSTYQGAPLCSSSVGSRIYSLIANTGEDPRLFILENDVLREIAVFKGLRLNRVTEPGTQFIAEVNDIIFVGGYEVDDNGNSYGRLDYYDGAEKGTAFVLRHYSTGLTSTITAIAPGRKDELLVAASNSVLSYNVVTRAFSQVSALSGGVSLAYLDGIIYNSAASSSDTIRRTKTSGLGRFPSSSFIWEPIWDGGYPAVEKIVERVTIETETLPTNTSVEFQLVLDGTTEITTDADNNTMAHASGTRTTFTISNATRERICRYVQPVVVLKTSDTSATPILLKWTLEFRASGERKFYQLRIDTTKPAKPAQGVLYGALAARTLRTLKENTSNRVSAFIPLALGGPNNPGGSHGSSTTENVQIADMRQSLSHQGEGIVTVRLAVLN